MRAFVCAILLLGAIYMAGMIYYTPVEFAFPQELYQSIGSKSANFQYMILSKSEQIVLLLKGWLFTPVQISETKSFKVRVIAQDFDGEIELPAKKSGIYTYMVQHLLILPKGVSKVIVGGYEISLDGFSYKTKSTRGSDSVSLDVLNSQMVSAQTFKVGEKISIMISAGMKNTGGYEVVVDSVDLVDKTIQIKAHVQSPSPSTPVTQAITYPAVIVEINEPLQPGSYNIICALLDNGEYNLSAGFEIF
ncbi:MAG TPA: protease complex subunit PrcB family protein [Pseudothermotoga sp.]